VRGVVVLVVPYVGKISMLFPPPTNYILVAIILVFIFISEFRRKPERAEGEPAPTNA
jgi:hypothetical protein